MVSGAGDEEHLPPRRAAIHSARLRSAGRWDPAALATCCNHQRQSSRPNTAAHPARRSRSRQPKVSGSPDRGTMRAKRGETGSLISKEEMLARVKKLTVAMTKTQLFSDIAENTALTRRQVADVFEALESVIERHVQKGAVGACTIPGLMKIKVMKKPAQRARKNVPNPFRPGETMDVKAKPASTSVKVLPLKKLKDMA